MLLTVCVASGTVFSSPCAQLQQSDELTTYSRTYHFNLTQLGNTLGPLCHKLALLPGAYYMDPLKGNQTAVHIYGFL